MGEGAHDSLHWEETLGRAKEGAGLGDGRVGRESQERHCAGTNGGAECDDDGKG